MPFNSFDYIIFLSVIFALYYAIPKHNFRLFLLVAGSYYFYMSWNAIFVLLVVASTLIDYVAGILLDKDKSAAKRNLILTVSIILNLGLLFYFKYYNFLAENIAALFTSLNLGTPNLQHSLILPAGISFYTFQSMSYTVDVYKKEKSAERNFMKYALYVSFFPQLIAGPIERAKNLFPQLELKHKFNYENIRTGCFLILFGLFKKIVFADRFAQYATEVFDHPYAYTGFPALLGVMFFSFQIYCDFSGYTDIARGSAKILGINLMENFKGPYLSKSIREFWRRWHISLSTWFRDYLYIPLGGNRKGTFKLYRNLIVVFLLTGLWHGANWTFIIWGLIHGFFIIGERILKPFDINVPKFFQILYTFAIVNIAWIFFRAVNLEEGLAILTNIFYFDSPHSFNIYIFESYIENIEVQISLVMLVFIFMLHFFEYKKDFSEWVLNLKLIPRWAIYIFLIVCIPLLGEYGTYKPFIYFQF